MEQRYQKSVMIALVPTSASWARQDLPHMTLAYAGEIPDLPESLRQELLDQALMLSNVYQPLTIPVIGTDVFGDDGKRVDVFLLEETDELSALQASVSQWHKSQHPFVPHVTVGPEGSIGKTIPKEIRFTRILVFWEEPTSYKLQGSQ